MLLLSYSTFRAPFVLGLFFLAFLLYFPSSCPFGGVLLYIYNSLSYIKAFSFYDFAFGKLAFNP